MTRKVRMGRDIAELIVSLLEKNYVEGGEQPAGLGADFARHVRELFRMDEQTDLYRKKIVKQEGGKWT